MYEDKALSISDLGTNKDGVPDVIPDTFYWFSLLFQGKCYDFATATSCLSV